MASRGQVVYYHGLPPPSTEKTDLAFSSIIGRTVALLFLLSEGQTFSLAYVHVRVLDSVGREVVLLWVLSHFTPLPINSLLLHVPCVGASAKVTVWSCFTSPAFPCICGQLARSRLRMRSGPDQRRCCHVSLSPARSVFVRRASVGRLSRSHSLADLATQCNTNGEKPSVGCVTPARPSGPSHSSARLSIPPLAHFLLCFYRYL